jgi:glucose-1-phosphate cytidylyltransferase
MQSKKIEISKIKVVILAGGLGTRLSEYTKLIPKPMIKVRKKPILFHIIEHYQKFGFRNFIIATGYKSDYIIEYFKNKKPFREIKNKTEKKNKDKLFVQEKNLSSFNIVETGLNTMTGGRIKRLKKHLSSQEHFCLTYGDGVSDVNLNNLLKLHIKRNKIATVTAVRPPSRFGALKIKRNKVEQFQEKTNFFDSWINGGFFIFKSSLLNFIKGDKTYLEKEPLQKISKIGQMNAYKHFGFWHCMDTLRDKENLEKFLKSKNAK